MKLGRMSKLLKNDNDKGDNYFSRPDEGFLNVSKIKVLHERFTNYCHFLGNIVPKKMFNF